MLGGNSPVEEGPLCAENENILCIFSVFGIRFISDLFVFISNLLRFERRWKDGETGAESAHSQNTEELHHLRLSPNMFPLRTGAMKWPDGPPLPPPQTLSGVPQM